MFKRKNLPRTLAVLVLLVAFFLVHRFLFLSGDFNTHDGVHFIRLYDLEKVLDQGQFPPRWLPDLGKGYGYPLFNFYPPLAYWAGLLFRLLGFSFTMANKLSFALAGFLGLLGMFALGKKLFGFWGGAVAAAFWLLLPYRAVDLYVRGSLAEYWGMNLLPGLFYLAKRYFDQINYKNFLLFSLAGFLLLITHNATALIGLIWLISFLLYLFFTQPQKEKGGLKKLVKLAAPFCLAVLMAAFFILPAILEKNLTQIADMTSDYFAYYNHFPSLYQLFISRYWGYGGSNFGTGDGMSFQIGHLHWLVAAVSLIILLIALLKKKLTGFLADKKRVWALFFGFSFLGFLFLAHQRSLPIWQKIAFLAYLQFPWRLLLFVGFSASILAGFLVSNLKSKKLTAGLFVLLTVSLLALNWSYFKPEEVLPRDDGDYLSGELWHYQQREFITDYLPLTVTEIPDQYYADPLVLADETEINLEVNEADRITFRASSVNGEEVVIKRFYFPGWQVKINQQPIEVGTNQNGFMVINLPAGESLVEVSFTNTPLRRLANCLSLLGGSLFLVIFIINVKKAKK